jgi:hypothetical protein
MSEIVTKNYPMIRKQICAKKDAQRLSIVYLPLLDTRELTIYWPTTDDNWMEQTLYFLNTYGSSDEKKQPNDWYVDDPVASGEVCPGKWRVVANRLSAKNEPPGVYQVLREGFLRELPATEALDDEARLMTDKVDPQNGKRIVTRYWQGVDPLKQEDLITARLAVKSRTNIHVRNQEFSGTFAVSDVYAQPMPEDGAIMIVEVLTELITVADVAALTALIPVITRENEIINVFALVAGEGDYTTAIYTNINPASRETIMGLSDANIITALTTSGGISGTWTYVDRKFIDQKDNTAQFIVLIKFMTWRSWATALAAGPSKMEYTEAGTERQGIKKYWFGVDKANLAAAVTALFSETSPAVETTHHIRTIGATDNHDGSITLTRSEEYKYDNIANTDGTLTGSKPIKPFALQSGAVAQLTSVYDGFTSAEILAVSDAVPSGYTLVDSENKPSGGYFSATFVYQKVTWKTWGTGGYGADTTEYQGTDGAGAGLVNKRETINKTWFGIRKADLVTAIADVRAGTNTIATSGYIITAAGVRDNQDGSITITQSQKMQVNNVDVGAGTGKYGKVMVNPHGWTGSKTGYIEWIETHYEHFTAAGLAAISETAPGGTFVLKSMTPSLDGDGFFSMIYRYESPTFDNTQSNTTLGTNRHITGIINDGGLDEKQQDFADGIPIATINPATIMAESASFVLDSVQARDDKDGSGSLHRVQQLLNAIDSCYAHQYNPAVGRREASITLLWKNISAANKVLLYNDAVANGTAMSAATYQPAPASHVLRDIICQDNGNLSWNVIRTTYLPLYSAGTDWDGGVSQQFYEEFTVPKFRISGSTKQVRKFRFHVWTLQTKSKSAADSWMTAVHVYDPIVGDPDHSSTTPVKTHLIFAGKNRYRSICIFGSCTDWMNERTTGAAGAYVDLGVATAT